MAKHLDLIWSFGLYVGIQQVLSKVDCEELKCGQGGYTSFT